MSERLTDARIDELLALESKATPGENLHIDWRLRNSIRSLLEEVRERRRFEVADICHCDADVPGWICKKCARAEKEGNR